MNPSILPQGAGQVQAAPPACAVLDAGVMRAILHDPRFDLSKRELKVVLHMLTVTACGEGRFAPIPIKQDDIVQAIGMASSHVSDTVNALLRQNVLVREGGRMGVNMDPETWIPDGKR